MIEPTCEQLRALGRRTWAPWTDKPDVQEHFGREALDAARPLLVPEGCVVVDAAAIEKAIARFGHCSFLAGLGHDPRYGVSTNRRTDRDDAAEAIRALLGLADDGEPE